ncbi:adult-specific rigid cuticular protein 15.5-like [Photinus pyralis]|uniref:adult-specific rigid cuticular protein 15.5-like n=1 Tax=Photinus pyralis TaxID=7054 RepID=UPI001266FE5B|nr:adult-specific rigid cuticular protein 15.5-like [Photinus pyralis]
MIALIVFTFSVTAVLAGEQLVAVQQDTLGNYGLKYAIDGISRVERGDLHGNVNGAFSYIDPYGIVRKTEFTSGVHGYNAIGTDIPLPVQDTPEVALAKANHLSVLRAAYLAPKLPQFQGPEEGFIAAPIPFAAAPLAYSRIAAPLAVAKIAAPIHFALPALSTHVGISETPEVLAARAQHFAAHAAARNAHLFH